LRTGGAKRACFELGRQLARQHTLHLYRIELFADPIFSLEREAERVYRYRYDPFGGLLSGRLARQHWFPESLTLFEPLDRLHRKIAEDISTQGYDVVLVHP